MPSEQDGQPKRAAFEILLHLTEPKDLEHARDEPFLNRLIFFTSQKTSINVGRSSKTISKQLQPSPENAYFDSAVVSREHAEIAADLEKGVLHVTDTGSMHGTALNGELLSPSTPTPIKSGDVLRFGVHVARGLDVFFPTECAVTIDTLPLPLKASYQAPDPIDLSDDESDCSSSIDSTSIDAVNFTPLKKFTPYIGDHGNIDRSELARANAAMGELVAAVLEDRIKGNESDDSDYEMEEDEDEMEDDEEESEESVKEDEEDPEHDDGGDFLDFELSRYNERPGEPPVEHDADVNANVDANVDTNVDTNVDANVDPNVDANVDAKMENIFDVDAIADADSDADADADNSSDTDSAEFASMLKILAEEEAAAAVQEAPVGTIINISSLLNPVAAAPPPAHESMAAASHCSPVAEKESVADALVTCVAAEMATWSSLGATDPGGVVLANEFFVAAPDVAVNNSRGETTSKKRKAEDMLAPVAAMDDLSTQTAGSSAPVETESSVKDTPPAAKRPATAVAVSAAKAMTKRRGVVWAVAEKIGVAALGGAVVLGSLIYTAPSF